MENENSEKIKEDEKSLLQSTEITPEDILLENTKDFDSWNISKKQINNMVFNKFYHSREIWWCKLGVNIGFEQDGTGDEYERPVLTLKGFSKKVCLIIPLTASLKKNKYYIPIGKVAEKEAQAIISQIRLIDTRRFIERECVLKKEIFEIIKKAIKDLF
jgi:mRNA interferase MazF